MSSGRTKEKFPEPDGTEACVECQIMGTDAVSLNLRKNGIEYISMICRICGVGEAHALRNV